MTVVANGEKREVGEQAKVADLLGELKLGTAACAVEVNKKIVPKLQHSTHALAEGDRIEIVTLVGGG